MLAIEVNWRQTMPDDVRALFFESEVMFSTESNRGIPSLDRIKKNERFVTRGVVTRPSVFAGFDQDHPMVELFSGISSRDELLSMSDRYFISVFIAEMPEADMMSREMHVGTKRIAQGRLQAKEQPLISTEKWDLKKIDGGMFWARNLDVNCRIEVLEPGLAIGWMLIDSVAACDAGFNNEVVIFNGEIDKHIETSRLMLILDLEAREHLLGRA